MAPVVSLKRLRRLALPLTKGQIRALRAIAAARDPESYIAGSTPLNRTEPRYSADIDIFHDREARVALAAAADADSLAKSGFRIEWLRRSGGMQAISAEIDGERVRLEWVADSDFRFFPAVADPLFGYTLHPADLAANKALAAADRREVRDLVDLVAIDERILSLGAVIWAAAEKAPGYTPEGLIAEIRRNSQHSREEWNALSAAAPIDPDATMVKLRAALARADAFVRRMPTEKSGLLFFSQTAIVEPDPDRLAEYATHAGARRGHWPSSPEIAAAMLKRLNERPAD